MASWYQPPDTALLLWGVNNVYLTSSRTPRFYGRVGIESILTLDFFFCKTRGTSRGPPYIVSPPENVTVNISQNALFTCQAEAYPGNLTYTWFWEEDNVYFKK
ncbi:hypothetical protein CCH79_00010329 [Gambusia affinis]|uniref:Ig-like domain-containing protein n=1 Tax=Gambusia affinis TaxID=33528 RepID=A0A315VIF4_GAMAF|nr:hypothetical protein CCH79_00010329 [Gambusia affinis]